MYYHVKIKFFDYFKHKDIDDYFTSVFINHDAEFISLNKNFIDENGNHRATKRFSIPLVVIETLEIKPIYED